MDRSNTIAPASLASPLIHKAMARGDCQRLIIGIAFVAISAVAAYFCISHSLSLMDKVVTTAQHVEANLLCYAGITYAIAGVVNTLYLSVPQANSYTSKELMVQGALTALAPIAPLLLRS